MPLGKKLAELRFDARLKFKLGAQNAGRDSAGCRVEDDGSADDVVVTRRIERMERAIGIVDA